MKHIVHAVGKCHYPISFMDIQLKSKPWCDTGHASNQFSLSTALMYSGKQQRSISKTVHDDCASRRFEKLA